MESKKSLNYTMQQSNYLHNRRNTAIV